MKQIEFMGGPWDGSTIHVADDVASLSIRDGARLVVYERGRLVEKVRVGSGMTGEQRRDFWRRRDELRGKVVEARGYASFASGALRHPQFVRFRTDKEARDCGGK